MHIREARNTGPEFVFVICVENAADGKDGSFGAWHRTTRHILTNLQHVLISDVSHLHEYFVEWADRDGLVGIATHCGLDGSGIEFRCGRRIFCSLYPSRLALVHTKFPVRFITWLCGLEWQWTPTPIKRRVQCIGLYLYSSSAFIAC